MCGTTEEQRICNEQPCPIDCEVGEWTQESGCNATCGFATQTRRREIVRPAAHGGRECPEVVETLQCALPECPVDCKLGEWSSWSECDEPCGPGQESRTRNIVQPERNGGKPCDPKDLVESRACQVKPCAEDCRLTEWSPWSQCSHACGKGTKERVRSVISQAKHGGKACAPLIEKQVCNERPCPVNCTVTDWSPWSKCSVSCGQGTRQRTRDVITENAHGGSACPITVESEPCNNGPCDVDCRTTPWSEWSECSADCGEGLQVRKRSVTQKQQANGEQCGPLVQVQTCEKRKCPVHCELSAWSPWSKCTAECGGGQRTRVRTVLSAPVHGGDRCGQLEETTDCNAQPCPIHCEVGDWTPWSECDVACGKGEISRTRKVVTRPENGGRLCPALTEVKPCERAPCPVNCLVSEFGPWSNCSSKCGAGIQTRRRTILRHMANDGLACPNTEEQRDCNAGPCPPIQMDATTPGSGDPTPTQSKINKKLPPQDCVVTEWEPWTPCSASCGQGTQERSRSIVLPARNGGAGCPALKEFGVCNTQPCQTDCKQSEWSVWSRCSKSCGGGIQTRSRTVVVAEADGGTKCQTHQEEAKCNPRPCEQSCIVSEWGEWSECDSECGEGHQIRFRRMLQDSQNGGAPCKHLNESRTCMNAPCPIKCKLSGWSNWTSCSAPCGGGFSTRERVILEEPEYGDHMCGELVQKVVCNSEPCPVDCEVSEWGEFSKCSAVCGGGWKSRERNVTRKARNGGRLCPALQQAEECGMQPCPVPCIMSAWSNWSACDSECGAGQRMRTRHVVRRAKFGAPACGETIEQQECSNGPCKIPCEMTEWSEWSACSKSCGIGSSMRYRNITRHPAFGAKECGELEQFKACNTQQCPQDCVVSKWGNWSRCNQECGPGMMSRFRSILRPSSNGGAACPPLKDEQPCILRECPRDCHMGNWGPWGECNAPCGGTGIKNRTRIVVQDAAFGGRPCGRLVESTECARLGCSPDDPGTEYSSSGGYQQQQYQQQAEYSSEIPSDDGDKPMCTFSAWSEWSQCSAKCGGGKRFRVRVVTSHGIEHGREIYDEVTGVAAAARVAKVQAEYNAKMAAAEKERLAAEAYQTKMAKYQAEIAAYQAQIEYQRQYAGYTGYEGYSSDYMVDGYQYQGSNYGSYMRDNNYGGYMRDNNYGGYMREHNYGSGILVGRPSSYMSNNPFHKQYENGAAPQSHAAPQSQSQDKPRFRQAIQINGASALQVLLEKKAQLTNEYEAAVAAGSASASSSGEYSGQQEYGFQSMSYMAAAEYLSRKHGKLGNVEYGTLVPKCGNTAQWGDCNTQPCGVDCKLSEWSAWSNCSQKCGEGVQSRSRTVVVANSNYGKPCGHLREMRQCVSKCPVDCKWSVWSAFTKCDPELQLQWRNRTKLVQASDGGKECVGEASEERKCVKQDCVVADWSPWFPCDGGIRTRVRRVLVEPKNGGAPCPRLDDNKECKVKHCELKWSNWTECLNKTQVRTAVIVQQAQDGGRACPSKLAQQRACTPGPQDCEVSEWGPWSPAKCEHRGQLRTRTRTIVVLAKMGGRPCPKLTEMSQCGGESEYGGGEYGSEYGAGGAAESSAGSSSAAASGAGTGAGESSGAASGGDKHSSAIESTSSAEASGSASMSASASTDYMSASSSSGDCGQDHRTCKRVCHIENECPTKCASMESEQASNECEETCHVKMCEPKCEQVKSACEEQQASGTPAAVAHAEAGKDCVAQIHQCVFECDKEHCTHCDFGDETCMSACFHEHCKEPCANEYTQCRYGADHGDLTTEDGEWQVARTVKSSSSTGTAAATTSEYSADVHYAAAQEYSSSSSSSSTLTSKASSVAAGEASSVSASPTAAAAAEAALQRAPARQSRQG
eukprot:TRINITY_DN66404_c3_g4_i3.p1 TRINITY_DN66404_c3_g4~~TRINITY_DN66404_c3_g4_i3.p1  ORF type:complete len:2189 (-),score=999.16 TRINITY_DN66404_c3_g4_i3:889-6498(-)